MQPDGSFKCTLYSPKTIVKLTICMFIDIKMAIKEDVKLSVNIIKFLFV